MNLDPFDVSNINVSLSISNSLPDTRKRLVFIVAVFVASS